MDPVILISIAAFVGVTALVAGLAAITLRRSLVSIEIAVTGTIHAEGAMYRSCIAQGRVPGIELFSERRGVAPDPIGGAGTAERPVLRAYLSRRGEGAKFTFESHPTNVG